MSDNMQEEEKIIWINAYPSSIYKTELSIELPLICWFFIMLFKSIKLTFITLTVI